MMEDARYSELLGQELIVTSSPVHQQSILREGCRKLHNSKFEFSRKKRFIINNVFQLLSKMV